MAIPSPIKAGEELEGVQEKHLFPAQCNHPPVENGLRDSSPIASSLGAWSLRGLYIAGEGVGGRRGIVKLLEGRTALHMPSHHYHEDNDHYR